MASSLRRSYAKAGVVCTVVLAVLVSSMWLLHLEGVVLGIVCIIAVFLFAAAFRLFIWALFNNRRAARNDAEATILNALIDLFS